MKIELFRQMRAKQIVILGFLIFATVLLPFAVQAQNNTDDWESQITINGWLPDINIATQFPDGSNGPALEVDAKTLLDNLSFTFQASLEVSKGSWGAYADLIYLKETARGSDSRDITIGGITIPDTVETSIKYGLDSWIVTLAGTYSLRETSQDSMVVLVGARMLDMDQQLNWSFEGDWGNIEPPPPSGSSSADVKNWDAIIGLRGHVNMGSDNRWVVPYYADIGTGDTDLTWQIMTGLGYRFNWGTLALNYRYLDYQPADDEKITDFTMSGPMLSASFKW